MITPFTIRPIDGQRDSQSYVELRREAFGNGLAAEQLAAETAAWLERQATWRAHVPHAIFGAFDGDVCAGSYQLDTRTLRLGNALFSVGCIGAVATRTVYRKQGVASALLRHATYYAQEQGLALLLLRGIPDFYHRFGYANVADAVRHLVRVDALPPAPAGYTLRAANPDDAPVMLALYTRHYNRQARTVDLQHLFLRGMSAANRTVLALDSANQPAGYLALRLEHAQVRIREIAADTWPAMLVLLQHAAELHGRHAPTETLALPIGLQCRSYFILAEHLPLTSEISSVPRAGWMARIGSWAAFAQCLAPAWAARWQRLGTPQERRIQLGVDDQALDFDLATGQTSMTAGSEPDVQMPGDTFLQLLCGYRPLAWAAEQPGSRIPESWMAVLERLVPLDLLWMPPSDEF